jgi:hypothetical protein
LQSLAAAQSPDALHNWMVNADGTQQPHVLEAMVERLAAELPTSDLSAITDGVAAQRLEYEKTLLLTALPHVREVVIRHPEHTTQRLTELVHAGIERRAKVLHAAGAHSYHAYLQQGDQESAARAGSEDLPALLIFIDAFTMLTKCSSGVDLLDWAPTHGNQPCPLQPDTVPECCCNANRSSVRRVYHRPVDVTKCQSNGKNCKHARHQRLDARRRRGWVQRPHDLDSAKAPRQPVALAFARAAERVAAELERVLGERSGVVCRREKAR